ncbi:MAG: hypothetical protein GF393_07750 [Armatimonadia bacterium]|nr:hypothetical protein [Armatimonadia bacterium]
MPDTVLNRLSDLISQVRHSLARAAGRRRCRSRARGGNMTVEFALLAPILLTLVFGGIEAAMIARTLVVTNYAANQGRRAAALGRTPSEISRVVRDKVTGLSSERVTVQTHRRTIDRATGSWGNWRSLGTGESGNDAQGGDEIRVRVSYRHQMLFGGNFIGMTSEDGEIELSTQSVALREGGGAMDVPIGW